MKTAKYCFTISTQTSGHYGHLTFTIAPIGSAYSGDFSAEIQWQTDDELRDGTQANWYSARIMINARHSIMINARHSDDVAALSKLLSKLDKTLIGQQVDGQDAPFALRKFTPANVARTLESIGCALGVYDARVSERVATADVADLSLSHYSNGFESVLAKNEAHARKLLIVKTASSRYTSQDSLTVWLSSGAKVTLNSHNPAPTLPVLATALAIPFNIGAPIRD